LNEAIDAAATTTQSCALFGGLSGLGWVTEHISKLLKQDVPPEDDPNVETDAAIRDCVSQGAKDHRFDLISGVVGYGVYFLERWPRPCARDGLKLVLSALEATKQETPEGTTWLSASTTIPEWQRDQSPEGRYDLGIAHGVTGVLQFLAQLHATVDPSPETLMLIRRTAQWIVAQAKLKEGGLSFAAWMNPDGSCLASRPVWCYGDLGIAFVLSNVRDVLKDQTMDILIGAMLTNLVTMPSNLFGVQDSALCHGATGIAHVFNRLYQNHGDIRCRELSLQWYERALQMFRPGVGVGGYLKCRQTAGSDPVWEPWPAFLDGSIGVGLALLSGVSAVEPAWDRLMLLSSRSTFL
jgi:hypothetical protein